MTTTSALHRSKSDRVICGVAAGLAEHFDVDPALVRIGWVVAACVSLGAAVLGYILLCVVVKDEETARAEPLETDVTGSGSMAHVGEDGPSTEVLAEELRLLFEVRRELGPEYEDEMLDAFVNKVDNSLRSRHEDRRPRDGGTRAESRGRSVLPWALLCIGVAIAAMSIAPIGWSVWLALCTFLAVGTGVYLLARRTTERGP